MSSLNFGAAAVMAGLAVWSWDTDRIACACAVAICVWNLSFGFSRSIIDAVNRLTGKQT